jgi:hypothetical protein
MKSSPGRPGIIDAKKRTRKTDLGRIGLSTSADRVDRSIPVDDNQPALFTHQR